MSITRIRHETISPASRNYSFRHSIEGRLTFRDISPVITRTKRVNFLRPTVHRIHSLAKSKALAVSQRSQNYIPNHSKYKRQETLTVTSSDILQLADSELIFWIEFNILSSTFSRSGCDALLSRIYLCLRSRV